ncbi:probable G-protein coupled receptor 25 [Gouania willdenowi]|uniref:Probable G-protein coupled receptor 25 n=1 Tax=Gouania willdenowi TaxID=441366 RepID=A0A8C5HVY4_GOUWI|nr:probable G-protein coupled receptor 25 [Gouania willdenowi]
MEDYTDYYPDYMYYYDSTDFGSLNVSQDCPTSHLQGSVIFLPIVYFLIFLTGFVGNLLVILVLGCGRNRGDGRLVDTFVVNLALADLIFVLTLPLWAISSSQDHRWHFGPAGDLLCKLSSYIIAVNRLSNVFFLTCMSIDRYLAVVKVMDSRFLRSSWCVRTTCAIVWLVSLVIGVPSLVYRSVESSNHGPSCVEDNQSTFFLVISLTLAILTFFFPLVIIVLAYGSIILRLNQHCKAAGSSRVSARRRHSLKMVFCIVVAFIVSWLPFNIFKAIIVISQLSEVDFECDVWQRDGLLIGCCLAFFNSCVNPAIYFFLDNHFRKRAGIFYNNCIGKTNLLQVYNSSSTNAGTTDTSTVAGRNQVQAP